MLAVSVEPTATLCLQNYAVSQKTWQLLKEIIRVTKKICVHYLYNS